MRRIASDIELCLPNDGSLSSIGGGFHTITSFFPEGAPSFVITWIVLLEGQGGTLIMAGQIGTYIDPKNIFHVPPRVCDSGTTRNKPYVMI